VIAERVPAPSTPSHRFFLSDGTLVTQRFHFAPMPHQYRHILGWYRLIHELRENGIRAICVFDGEERTVAKSHEVCVSLYFHSCLVDTMQQNRRRHIRRTDALRGEIESDRLRRLLALTKGLDALRLLDKNERPLFMTSFRDQMASLESHFVPKHYLDQLSSTDQSLRRHFDVEPSLDQREIPWLDEVDLDELYYKNGLSVAADIIAPEEIDLTCVASQVASHENKHRPLGLAANTALGLENLNFTTPDSYCRTPAWSINARADMFSSRPQRWTSLRITKRVKNGKVWLRP
jgi:hypothetical protein